MPSFETLILSSPSGFTQACQLANTLITENEAYFVDLVSPGFDLLLSQIYMIGSNIADKFRSIMRGKV